MTCKSAFRPKWTWLPSAKSAISCWPAFEGAKLRHVTFGENATWKVTNSRGAFALRVYRPGRWTDSQILVEHSLMKALGAKWGVLSPLRGVDGESLQVIPGTDLRAALYPWAPGRLHLRKPNERRVRRLGHYIAGLHNHLAKEKLEAHIRKWDLETLLFGPLKAAKEVWSKECPLEPFSKELQEWAFAIRDKWLAASPLCNLLHADLHMGNIKWSRVGISCIDFDDCGWAPLAYDLAVCSQGCHALKHPETIGIMVKAYNEVAKNQMSPGLVKLFIIVRNYWALGWISERPELFDEGKLGERIQGITKTIENLIARQWLEY